MIDELKKLPNALTAIRFMAVPVMWVYAFRRAPTGLGIGYLIGLTTDLLDGAVARRLGQTSAFGSKFDSAADQLLQISSIVWILMLMPEIFSDNPMVSAFAIGTYGASLVVGLLKFKRLANMHLYLSKVGGLLLYLFLIHAFLVGRYSLTLFRLAVGLFILSSLETLVLQLTSSEPGVDSGSILFRYVGDDHPLRIWLSRLP